MNLNRIESASPYLLLVLTTLFWAGNFVVGRALHGSIPPIALAFWRWTGALLIVLPLAYPRLRTQWLLLRRSWKKLFLCGLLGVGCFNTFIYIALQTTSATNALLINSTIPVLIIFLSWIFCGTLLTRRQALGVLVSLAGVITIVCRADLNMLLSLRVNSGDLWVLVAVVCWSVYTLLLRKRPAGLHPLSFLTAIIVAGLLGLAPFYAWELSQGFRMTLTPLTFAGLCYVSLFASVLAFIMWNHSVDRIGANRAGLFLHLMPVFGTILSIIFLGEAFHLFHAAGIGLIFSGIYLTTAV
jgi:drug/metabolite transporter (DMT)-like permease